MMAVMLSKAKIESLDRMAEGGEAIIYEYPGNKVLKEFRSTVNISQKRQKVSRFISLPMPNGVIAPKEEVIVDGRFAGYIMDKFSDAEAVHELTKGKYIKIANINNKELLEIVIKIGKTISKLHSMGIVLGDISDYNELFKANGSKKDIGFIDVDSWGVGGLRPDAYTESFTAPECYRNGRNMVDLTAKTDLFSFAVLVFNILTRIHPFNGTFEKAQNMLTPERILRGISVLGKEKIIIPKMIPSWNWMSPDLQRTLFETFEKGRRTDITDILEDQLKNSKYCQVHDMYYYSKYSVCSLCDASAKVIMAPVIIRVHTNNGPVVRVLFESSDVKVLLNPRCYISKGGDVVHKATGRKVGFQKGKQVDFTEDGKFTLIADKENVEIFDKDNNVWGTIERQYGTYCQIVGSDLYCIDKSGDLLDIKISEFGNIKREVVQAFDPLFSVSDSGDVFCISLYPKKAIVKTDYNRFEVNYDGKIKEYAIKQDSVTKNWLFIYKMTSGKYRTIVFGKNDIEYNSDYLNFNASPLLGLCFNNSIIFDPGNGKIIGTSYIKNVAKEFSCNVVDESSKLDFKDGGFVITTDEKIYSFK